MIWTPYRICLVKLIFACYSYQSCTCIRRGLIHDLALCNQFSKPLISLPQLHIFVLSSSRSRFCCIGAFWKRQIVQKNSILRAHHVGAVLNNLWRANTQDLIPHTHAQLEHFLSFGQIAEFPSFCLHSAHISVFQPFLWVFSSTVIGSTVLFAPSTLLCLFAFIWAHQSPKSYTSLS